MGGGDTGELEWVDAEAPDWSGPKFPAVEADGATPAIPDGRAVAALRAQGRAQAARSRATVLLPPPWQSQEIASCRFCVIDFETSRSKAGHDDEIREIGAVQVHGFELGRDFATAVQSRALLGAARPGGAAPFLEQALPWLLEMARDRVLVFHNARFDLPLLQRACVETGRELLAQPVLDTVVLARRLVGPPCGLGHVAARLGLAVGVLHRAPDDARLTASLLVELLALCVAGGITRLAGIPALRLAPAHARRRRGPHADPLLQRLEQAIRRREALCLSYHVGRGVAPLVLELRPQRLVALGALLACDVARDAMVWLDVGRIGRVHTNV